MTTIIYEPIETIQGFVKREILITCNSENTYKLSMTIAGAMDIDHIRVLYYFSNKFGILFSGDQYGVPLNIDSLGITATNLLLELLCQCKTSYNTDENYFQDYTIEQLEFSESLDALEIKNFVIQSKLKLQIKSAINRNKTK